MGLRGNGFAALAAALALTASLANAQDPKRGEVLYDLCAQCHGPTGAGDALYLAPAIAGMDLWYLEAQLTGFRSGLRGMHFDDVTGMRMRPMALTLENAQDVKSIAAYVASLPKVKPAPTVEGGDAARGAALYATCIACHGADGNGNEALRAPRLAGQSDWYLVTQLAKFKAGVRGSDPTDTWGIMMRPMALTLADEQAVKDVIAHIQTLSK